MLTFPDNLREPLLNLVGTDSDADPSGRLNVTFWHTLAFFRWALSANLLSTSDLTICEQLAPESTRDAFGRLPSLWSEYPFGFFPA